MAPRYVFSTMTTSLWTDNALISARAALSL